MDILNLQPEDLNVEDTTFEVEGFEDHIEEAENAFPEKDFRTPAEKAAEEQAQQQATPEQPTAVQPTPEATPQKPKEPESSVEESSKFNFTPDPVTGEISDEQLFEAYGEIPEPLQRKLALKKTYIPEEDEVRELWDDGNNLQKQLQAFMMVRDNPALLERYDHNGDGQYTYADANDTTNLNGGAGMTPEEDAIATEEWLEGFRNPDAQSRLQALWQQNGAGQNMSRYINLRRAHALKAEKADDRNVGEGIRQSTAGGLFDMTATGLEIGGRFENVLNGKSFFEDSDLDERVLQTTNENSLEYMVNHNLRRSAMDTITYEAGYWAIPSLLSGGLAGKAGAAMQTSKIPAFIKAGQFLKPSLTGGKAVFASNLTTKQIGIQTIRPAAGWLGRQKAVQGINLVKSAGKTVALDTLPFAAFTDLEEKGRGMMYEDGFFKKVFDDYPEGAIFAPQIAKGMNSPLFKQADFMATEMAYGVMGMVTLGGLGKAIYNQGGNLLGALPSVPGKVTRYAQKNLDQLSVSTRSWSTKIDSELLNQEAFFKKSQQQISDISAAASEQINKASDGFSNAFSNAVESDGVMKSAYGAYKNGSAMLGQGYSKAKDGIRQVINDLDEIRHTVGVGKPGSTNSLFSQTDMAKAGKAGIPGQKFDNLAKELVEDIEYGKQIEALDPGQGRRSVVSKTSLEGITEAVKGRDASRLRPRRFWGQLYDQKLKVGNYTKSSELEKWAFQHIEVQDAVNKSLLIQLRDQANAADAMIGKTDIFSTDGPMRRIADNLTSSLHQIKKTQHTWSLAADEMAKNNGTLTPDLVRNINKKTDVASKRLLQETRDNVNIMTKMLMDHGDEDLAGAVLDVFKVAGSDIHGWKDFDAWMHQAVVGGKFNGQVKTGDLVRGLQKTMVQSILSGPKTPMRAMMGTTINSYLNSMNEAFGAMIRQPFTGDIVARKAAVAKFKGQLELVPEALQVFRKEWNNKFKADIANIQTRYTQATPDDDLWTAKAAWVEQNGTAGEKAAFYINNTTRTLTNNKLFSWSPRALAATDDTFRWLMARSRSKEKAMRTVLAETGDDFTKITPELLQKAEDLHYKDFLDGDGNLDFSGDSYLDKQFKEVTLTTPLKDTAAKLDDVFNSIPAIKPFYLFARTGINGLNFTYKNTPLLGALHKESLAILKHTGSDFTELAEYGIKNAADLASARNLFAGRQAVGAGVVTTFGGMYMAGQLTGNGPADRQLKQNWLNAGWKPNHVYIGDVGFDYTTLEPYNIIFSTIADIGDNIELMGSDWAEKRLQAVAYVVGRGLTGKTYMSGLDQLMQIAQMKPGAFDKAAANILNNSVPLAGMRNEFGKWVNPHMKELNSSTWDSIRNRNQATEGLAGLTGQESLPEKSDLLNGKPIKNWNIIGRSFNAVSPVSLDIRNDTPGRRLLLNSNYDLKSTTYAYGGYSFVKDNHVRAHFQKAIGTVPITIGFKKFKNVEEALNHLSTRQDVKKSMKDMKKDSGNPANWDLDPNTYPHNTLIDNVMNQARSKAWAKINAPEHPGYSKVQQLKAEKDGKDSKTRDNRQEILDLSFPKKQIDQFPKN